MNDANVSPCVVARWSDMVDRQPAHARVGSVDLVIVRLDDEPRAFYGRCTHRNALLADGFIEGDRLVCRSHGWDYACDDGRSSVGDGEGIPRFRAWVQGDDVLVDADEVRRWRARTPMDFAEDELDP